MRSLILFTLLFPLVTSAQTIGDTIEEMVLGTQCEQLVNEATNDLRIMLYATKKGDWDNVFRYTELVFQELVIARSYCEDEPEQLVKANKLMHDYDVIYKGIVCAFHVQETYRRLTLSDKIINDVDGDWEEALFHSDWATYHVDEAVNRCSHLPDKVEALKEVRIHTYNLAATVRSQVESEKE